jgi:hypothetical protein
MRTEVARDHREKASAVGVTHKLRSTNVDFADRNIESSSVASTSHRQFGIAAPNAGRGKTCLLEQGGKLVGEVLRTSQFSVNCL